MDRRDNLGTIMTEITEPTQDEQPGNKRATFDLTASSSVMVIDGTASFVAAFALPPGASRLAVQSVYESHLPTSTYVDPVIVFLGADKQRLIKLSALPLRHSRHVIMPGLWEWYYGETVELPAGAAFVVVASDPASTRHVPTRSDNGVFYSIPPAPIGSLALVPN